MREMRRSNKRRWTGRAAFGALSLMYAAPVVSMIVWAATAQGFRSHNVFYTEAELMGIRWPGAADRLSFASRRFVSDRLMKRVAGGVLVVAPD